MIQTFLLTVFALNSCVNCDWVKLPQMTNTPKVNYKIQTVASFSDLSPSSILTNSDVLSSVFSFNPPTNISSTTEMTLITEATLSQNSKTKKYFPSTATSKTIGFIPQISDRIDQEELLMEAVKLMPAQNKKVIVLNKTIPVKVQPTEETDSGKKLSSVQESEEEDGDVNEEEDGDVSEDEDLDSSDEAVSSEEYEYEFDEPEPLSTSTTTTKAPRKAPSKPQRRVIQVASMKAKPHNHLNFTSFIKFLKNIQQSFATRTAKNINEKVNMLRKFRDKLLLAVNQRIKTLWKTQSKKKRSRRTLGSGGGGGWMEQNGGGMDFPSAEGALLSISFLTFAVFLIKLVLQVIQTIKMKKYAWAQQMNPMTVDPTLQQVVIKRHRSTRKVTFSDPETLSHYAKILSSIETLKV